MENGIGLIGAIVTNTPVWVFALFALLIFMGVQASRSRLVNPRRMLIAPAVFIAWGLVGLVLKPHFSMLLAGDWIAALAVGAAIGWSTTRLAGMRVDHAAGRVHLPGSKAPLIRFVSIFLIKYVLNAAMAINPAMITLLAPWDVAVSGLMAGYFIGWLARFLARYRSAPSGNLATAALPEVSQ